MSLFKNQTFISKELIDGWCHEDISIDQHIKRELIWSIFNDIPALLDGGTVSYSFITFDWNSKPDHSNRKYHHIINDCGFKQLKFYEINVNISE